MAMLDTHKSSVRHAATSQEVSHARSKVTLTAQTAISLFTRVCGEYFKHCIHRKRAQHVRRGLRRYDVVNGNPTILSVRRTKARARKHARARARTHTRTYARTLRTTECRM